MAVRGRNPAGVRTAVAAGAGVHGGGAAGEGEAGIVYDDRARSAARAGDRCSPVLSPFHDCRPLLRHGAEPWLSCLLVYFIQFKAASRKPVAAGGWPAPPLRGRWPDVRSALRGKPRSWSPGGGSVPVAPARFSDPDIYHVRGPVGECPRRYGCARARGGHRVRTCRCHRRAGVSAAVIARPLAIAPLDGCVRLRCPGGDGDAQAATPRACSRRCPGVLQERLADRRGRPGRAR